MDAGKLIMKIIFGIDPINFFLTGIGRYTYELANRLKLNTSISKILFLKGFYLHYDIPIYKKNTSVLKKWINSKIRKSYFFTETYRLITPWIKTYVLKKYHDMIYHSPNFYLPPHLNNCLATFHDLSVFTLPQCHPLERIRFMQKELLLTIKRADILITHSQFIRFELAKYFNFPLNRIYTAPLASSGDFYPRNTEQLQTYLAPLGLKVNYYCLFVGSIEPRKNIKTLLYAYERLPLTLRLTIPLVISGFEGWKNTELLEYFKRAENSGWLYYLGYTASEILPYLFSGARSFLFPSLYEGFGLPVLEAMASGVPVVCSNNTSLPEVAGDCALMCSAKDIDLLTELIKKSIEDNIWREQAKINGIKQSKKFSWDRCAQETIFAYQQI